MTRFPAREALGQRLQRRLGSALCCLVAEAAGRTPDYLDDLLVIHSRSPANAGVRTSCTSAFVRCGRTRIPRPARSSNALDRLATAVAPVLLFRYHRTLLRQRALVAHPLQARLVAEALLVGYRELFH